MDSKARPGNASHDKKEISLGDVSTPALLSIFFMRRTVKKESMRFKQRLDLHRIAA
ncbi:hypothetical protein NSMM_110004 [Nitrosomonas mobilis]|uniref:Uncharacterized protein n=1 Tax=Nitrosomonas mobilis TaxID=51642 RepID=A0A1G5SAG7_9PROT|nr:hypothetical protein NSMM_110004 [Nitrosomonas mobilis]